MGELMRISRSLWARGRVHPGQVASPSRGNTGTHRTNNHAHTHSFTPKGNLERPINLTVLSLVSGRKQEYLVRTHANSIQKDFWPGVKPRKVEPTVVALLCNSATNCATVQPMNLNTEKKNWRIL
ncbi:hypothetical protein ATANTOWER_003065 [Ataeniobius toweri]|uniref:Uncharacterized protein n=1 Tax=Ataeniobius toweri TaxID=208326 RepID=A0ABU7C2W5_9TELE|nr:hypothetical protein [Ataeniobius toweri]